MINGNPNFNCFFILANDQRFPAYFLMVVKLKKKKMITEGNIPRTFPMAPISNTITRNAVVKIPTITEIAE
jgi:hypothetical protein